MSFSKTISHTKIWFKKLSQTKKARPLAKSSAAAAAAAAACCQFL